MNDSNLGYVPVAQSFAASYVGDGQLQAATHSFVAPESHPIVPIKELPGDYVSPNVDTMDVPSWKSLSGITVICLMTAIVLSMFACLGRADFTFPFLLFAYMVWCWESTWSSIKITQIPQLVTNKLEKVEIKPVSEVYEYTSSLVPASSRTIRNVQGATLLLILATCIDAIWIFAAYNAWTCDFSDLPSKDSDAPVDPLACFNPDTQTPLMITHGLHRWVLRISNVNFVLKVFIIVLSTLWTSQQRKTRVGPHSKPLPFSFAMGEAEGGSLLSL
eukprot:Protomagalhaensia_wolfi_Nauph_80__1995@NODE_2262_length_1145_cov_194_401447_g1767_i0_p1_GENE_NODE_2262_length_1145_cov_194_401447_g1767_i0NODE_2262_length_1145_cov_194_401447_g1767_i0_p1_ORF_typecomplete_len274_score27_38DUF2895/PF11444_8/0_27DUF2895/PF11444_8/2_1e03PIR/PF00399_19/0_38PIR/PF00399_19/1_1e04_NODE_2262_length_1145_cov_194_401447_g1767_i01871008